MTQPGGMKTYAMTFFVIALLAVVLIAVVISESKGQKEAPQYGVTFSMQYARHLQLDAGAAYLATLDDLEAKRIRIPIYWSQIQYEEDKFDWSEIDWMMDRAAERDATVTLVTGMKVPRWPECYVPDWAASKIGDDLNEAVLSFVEATVTRYRYHPALERWQVENEPFFPFGVCPSASAKRLYSELNLVKALDPHHPLVRTTSGEQSIWLTNAPQSDVLGVSLYRVVSNPVLGTWVFPIPSFFYSVQAKIVEPFVDKVIISELQAEPWLVEMSDQQTAKELVELFDEDDLRMNARYAERTGIDEIYFWGVEWWYYLKIQGEDELWETAKEYFVHEETK